MTVTPEQRPYSARGAARTLFGDRSPEVLLSGPAGTGKSRAALEKIYAAAAKYAGCRILILRKTRASLTESALVTWEQDVVPAGHPCLRGPAREQRHVYRMGRGAEVVVGGLDKDSKVMSSQYDMIYVQEATELDVGEWEVLTTRLRNGRMPYAQLLADCNPGSPEHWLKKRCEAGTTTLLESRHEDNPRVVGRDGRRTAEGEAYLRRLDALTGHRYQRLRLGLWVAAEGMYFPEWDPAIHVIAARDLPAEWPRWTATDWGFADPFCTLWLARDPRHPRQIYVYRELYASGLRDEQQAALIASKSQGERLVASVGDPSMFNARSESQRPSIATVYAAHGVRLTPATNSRLVGWQTVRRALAVPEGQTLPRLQVMRERCPHLIRTLPAMVHDPLDQEDLADTLKSTKTEDHAVDTLRYGLMAEHEMDRARAGADFARQGLGLTIRSGGALSVSRGGTLAGVR